MGWLNCESQYNIIFSVNSVITLDATLLSVIALLYKFPLPECLFYSLPL